MGSTSPAGVTAYSSGARPRRSSASSTPVRTRSASPRGRRRAGRRSPARSRTARSTRGGRRADRRRASRWRAYAARSPVRMSGAHSRSAAASRASGSSASAHSSQPSCEPAPRTGRSPVLHRHHVGHEVARAAGARERVAAGARSPAAAGVEGRERPQGGVARPPGSRRRRAAARGRCRPAAGSRRRPRRGWRIDRVAPALLRVAPPLAGRVPHEAAARVERARQPLPRRPPRRLELGRERGVTGRGQHDEEPRRGVGRAVVGERARRPASPPPRAAPGASSRNSWPILPGASSVPGVVAPPLPGGEGAQRGGRDVRPRGQHLQRGDQRVAAEQRVEAPGIAWLDRRRRRVRPALVREQPRRHRGEWHGADGSDSIERDDGTGPRRQRRAAVDPLAVPRAIGRHEHAPGQLLDLHRRVGEVERDGDALAAPPRPRALGRGQRRVGAVAQVRALAPQRDQVAHEVERRARVRALGVHVAPRRRRRSAASCCRWR